ncbi:hypothetical protein [Methanobrevibacter sp.]
MSATMVEIAKEKDNGTMAKTGMRWVVAQWFNIDMNAVVVTEIVDTYLECINNISIGKWLYGLYSHGRPMIFTCDDLKSSFSDLLMVSDDLDMIADLFMYLYEQEFYVCHDSKCIFSTNFKDFKRKPLDFIGIVKEYERLCTLHSVEMLTWNDIDSLVECLNKYGYDIEKNYKIRTDDVYETAIRIEERLQQVFLL